METNTIKTTSVAEAFDDLLKAINDANIDYDKKLEILSALATYITSRH